MLDGKMPWTMTEEGEWILNEPYKTMLMECKAGATQAWVNSVIGYLANATHYSPEKLTDELNRRVSEQNLSAMEIVDEFIIEALEGDL